MTTAFTTRAFTTTSTTAPDRGVAPALLDADPDDTGWRQVVAALAATGALGAALWVFVLQLSHHALGLTAAAAHGHQVVAVVTAAGLLALTLFAATNRDRAAGATAALLAALVGLDAAVALWQAGLSSSAPTVTTCLFGPALVALIWTSSAMRSAARHRAVSARG
ncbi:hypothetical protein [Williamsia sterculiae]|uniref:Uncharacterized protein n=1 Tax=Williamsia sterculiae TaxID=1344003 RepID=A0A1N7CIX9_9NOCA|nr:hypothetical protein [Williamsia sterculiae]SIR63576.1 hypothetical protein SAMN05445060_0171 [Williamsia sterculiae]